MSDGNVAAALQQLAHTLESGATMWDSMSSHPVFFWEVEFRPEGDIIVRNTGCGLRRFGLENEATIGTKAENWPGLGYYWEARRRLLADPELPYVVLLAKQTDFGPTLDVGADELNWVASFALKFTASGSIKGMTVWQIPLEWAEPFTNG